MTAANWGWILGGLALFVISMSLLTIALIEFGRWRAKRDNHMSDDWIAKQRRIPPSDHDDAGRRAD